MNAKKTLKDIIAATEYLEKLGVDDLSMDQVRTYVHYAEGFKEYEDDIHRRILHRIKMWRALDLGLPHDQLTSQYYRIKMKTGGIPDENSQETLAMLRSIRDPDKEVPDNQRFFELAKAVEERCTESKFNGLLYLYNESRGPKYGNSTVNAKINTSWHYEERLVRGPYRSRPELMHAITDTYVQITMKQAVDILQASYCLQPQEVPKKLVFLQEEVNKEKYLAANRMARKIQNGRMSEYIVKKFWEKNIQHRDGRPYEPKC